MFFQFITVARHSLLSLMTNHECVIEEVTGQMTSRVRTSSVITSSRSGHLRDLNLAVCTFSGCGRSSVLTGTCTLSSSDTEPPWIQCPENIVAGTDERRGTANVSWDVPSATDNSKEEV